MKRLFLFVLCVSLLSTGCTIPSDINIEQLWAEQNITFKVNNETNTSDPCFVGLDQLRTLPPDMVDTCCSLINDTYHCKFIMPNINIKINE